MGPPNVKTLDWPGKGQDKEERLIKACVQGSICLSLASIWLWCEQHVELNTWTDPILFMNPKQSTPLSLLWDLHAKFLWKVYRVAFQRLFYKGVYSCLNQSLLILQPLSFIKYAFTLLYGQISVTKLTHTKKTMKKTQTLKLTWYSHYCFPVHCFYDTFLSNYF